MAPLQKTFPLTADVQIPAVGFGTYLIASEQAAEAVRTAISISYRHVDTASVYQNEEAVGAGMHAGLRDAGLRREEMFVTTKLWPGAREFGEEIKSYEETIAEFDASLTRLGLKDVDLYLIHSPHAGAGRLDQWRAMLEIKRSGKARSVGVSNFSRKHLEEIEAAGLTMPDVNQVELHPWSQKPDLIAYMRERHIAPIAYSSLAPPLHLAHRAGTGQRQDRGNAGAGCDLPDDGGQVRRVGGPASPALGHPERVRRPA